MYCILTPYYYFIEITKDLDAKYDNFFKNLGKIQGRAATEIQIQVYGLKGDFLFNTVCEQSEISAMGRVEIIRKNPFVYKIHNNLNTYFKNNYKKEDYRCLDYYFKNNIKGVFETCYNLKCELIDDDEVSILNIIDKGGIEKLSREEKEINSKIDMKALITKASLQQ